ncbi:hypothetical protein BDW62DRAFT_193988 [Aspergillus aurantiobrunneus]
MGGIPYKSQGCANCKKRRIKCDLVEPECAKCIKKGILCPGYDKHRNFLHHTVVSRVERNGETRRPIPQLVGHLKPLALPAGFNMSAEARTQLFSTFVDTFFAPNTYLNGKDDSWYFLMTRFPTLAGESELLDRAVIALACVFMGRRIGDCHLAQHGVEIYNSALRLMAGVLQRKCPPTPDILYAAIVFHTYETMHSHATALRNCFVHVQGTTAILKHHNYDGHSDQSLIQAILTRQKWAVSYFIINTQFRSEVDWQCLTLGKEDSPLDELFGMIAKCAFLQRDLDKILAQPFPPPKETHEALVHRCLALECNLQVDWLTGPARKLDGSPSPCSRTKFSQEPSILPPDPNITPYEFPSLGTAKTYLLLWVASIVARRVMYKAEKLSHPSPDPKRMLFYAGEVSRSVAYCLLPKRQMSCGQVVLFAVSQASKCYIETGEKEMFMWCQGVYPIIQSRGFDMALRLSEVEWEFWNAMQRGSEAAL